VFDLLFTLVAPTLYPGSRTRLGWIEDVTGIPEQTLRESWVTAEPDIEAGRSPNGCEPVNDSIELGWLKQVAIRCGQTIPSELMNTIELDWDLCRRTALQPIASRSAPGLSPRFRRSSMLPASPTRSAS